MAQLRSLREIEPIKHLGARVTVPLAYAAGNDFPWPEGSGTLLHKNDRLFLLTAAHIFDDRDINRFWLPTDRVGGRPRPIGSAKLWRPKKRDQFDIAVVELHDEDLKDALRLSWSSVSTSSIAEASAEGTFFLFGYPSVSLRPEGKTLRCSLITACSHRLRSFPANAKPPVEDDIDLFFLHEEKAEDEDGEIVESPRLVGVSGGGIWEVIEHENGGLWTAEKNLKLVGVQSSAIHGEWFRAKSAMLALDALN